MTELSLIDESAAAIRGRFPKIPKVAVVLGSGLSDVLRTGGTSVPYAELPNFPRARVAGHSGVLEVGDGVAVLRGRSHHYEGHPMEAIVRPVRALARLGVETFLLTNAAGACRRTLRPGDLMIIEDHLNLLGANPLRGENIDELGTRFPDLSAAYDPALRKLAAAVAKSAKVRVARGVYAAVPGPSYETPAEIRMVARAGADAVGMSTVPEAIALRHMGRRVAAISCITNLAAGLSKHPLTHAEVLETTKKAGQALDRLLRGIVEKLK